MMPKLSSLLPSPDLLDKLEGLEASLRKRRAWSRFGWLSGAAAALVSVLQIFSELVKSGVPQGIQGVNPAWGIAGGTGLLVILLATWFRKWLKESHQPFRYSCSIGEFTFVAAKDQGAPASVNARMAWLPHDLGRHLNQRITRLLFSRPPVADDKQAANDADHLPDQHIHIEGRYLVRERSSFRAASQGDNLWEVVVMPRIRVGGENSPEKLAMTVSIPLEGSEPILSVLDYDQLIEHVYFSVVTEIYRRIQDDVQRKIELLPTRAHKAVAYYYEAEDYARSNTLRAYEEASRLFRLAASHFEPYNELVSMDGRRRLTWKIGRQYHTIARAMRCRIHTAVERLVQPRSHAAPPQSGRAISDRPARHAIIAAKAKLGYANMLSFRHLLAMMLGQREVSIFEARRFAEDALRSIQCVSPDAPGYLACLFDAHVANALTLACLGDFDGAEAHLRAAREADPQCVTTAALYLLAKSRVQFNPRAKNDTLLLAIEQNPRLEVAQFLRAEAREMLWRSGKTPVEARRDADLVIESYQDVLRINPGNIAAAANAAFVYWLLGKKEDLDCAMRLFVRALDYYRLAPETIVWEHHYGLARIHAERGEFERAYEHVLRAEDGRRAHRRSHGYNDVSYFFDWMSDDLLQRWEQYKQAVLKDDAAQSTDERSRYARDKVCAFVLNEYAMACWTHYKTKSLDDGKLKTAIRALEQSVERDPSYVWSVLHLASVETDRKKSLEFLERANKLDPTRPYALLELARFKTEEHCKLTDRANKLEELVKKLRQVTTLVEAKQETIHGPSQKVDFRVAATAGPDLANSLDSKNADLDEQLRAAEGSVREAETSLGIRSSEREPETSPAMRERKMPKIDELNARMESHEREAKRCRDQAEIAAQESQRAVRELLPHPWLWKFSRTLDGDIQAQFDYTSVSSQVYRRQAKWERDFSAFDAIALWEWCRPTIASSSPSERANTQLVLEHIARVFFPGDFEVLLGCQSLETDESVRAGTTEKLQRIVLLWLEANPLDVQALQSLADQRIQFPLSTQAERLRAAQKQGQVPAALLRPLAEYQLDRGDDHFKNGKSEDAARCYEEVLALPECGNKKMRAMAAGKLAMLRLEKGAVQGTDNLISASLHSIYDLLSASNKEPFGTTETFLDARKPVRLLLEHGYRRCYPRDATVRPRAATDAIMGLLAVAGQAPAVTGGPPMEHLNVRAPLAVEWDQRLLPSDDAAMDEFIMKDAAPGVRERLIARYGITIPGIRFRGVSDASQMGAYRILDHEVIVEDGAVAAGTDSQWQEPLRRTVQRLQLHLERHLAQWIRVQEVQNLLEKHCYERYSKDIPGFETHAHIAPLTSLLRSLVAERVPLLAFSKIYDAYRSMWEAREHVQNMTREIRMLPAIKPMLWGNDPSYRRFVLRDRDEDELWRACKQIDGFTALVLEREQRDAWVSSLVSQMSGEHPTSLTVRRPELRPLVRRLIELPLPDCPVLADRELEYRARAVEPVEIGLRATQLAEKVVA